MILVSERQKRNAISDQENGKARKKYERYFMFVWMFYFLSEIGSAFAFALSFGGPLGGSARGAKNKR